MYPIFKQSLTNKKTITYLCAYCKLVSSLYVDSKRSESSLDRLAVVES